MKDNVRRDMIKAAIGKAMHEKPSLTYKEISDSAFEQLGGGLIEMALTYSVVMNSHTCDRLIKMTSMLRASSTEKGREQYAYDNDYTRDGQIRAVLNGTDNRVRDLERKIINMVRHNGALENIENFDAAMAESNLVFDGCIKPVTDALTRFFIIKQVEDGYKEDVLMRADVLTTVCICHVNQEMYAYLTAQLPIISCFQAYSVLSGWTFLQQAEKIEKLMVGENYASECKNDKRCCQMLSDLSRIVFSTETLGKVLEARGVHGLAKTTRSCIEGFESSTMSLNYYRQHYEAMYLVQEIGRLNKDQARKGGRKVPVTAVPSFKQNNIMGKNNHVPRKSPSSSVPASP